MSFKTLIDELLADEKAGILVRDAAGNLVPKGFVDEPRHVTKAFDDEEPRYVTRAQYDEGSQYRGLSSSWLKSFRASHKRAMARIAAYKTRKPGEFSATVKAIKAETAEMRAELRKAELVENFSRSIAKHAAFGLKLTAEVNAGNLTAEQTSILESCWNQNGSALEMVGKRLGLR